MDLLAGADDDPVIQLMLAAEASAVAQFLGIPIEQLQAELGGQSLAQVARQHGKDVRAVTRVVVATAHQQLDEAVALGHLPAESATGYKFQISLFAPLLVNSKQASQMALSTAKT